MKNADDMPKVAGMTEKDLPGAAVPAAGVELPAREKAAANPALRTEPSATTLATGSTAADRASALGDTSSTASISGPANTDLHLRALERTHDMVALHAMRLSESNADSLRLVIKPGAGLQLSLELRQHEGTIEAQAILHQGDFGQLNQHWSELQQRLQQRGIRLAPLVNQDHSAGHGGSQREQHQPANRDPLYASAFAEFALGGSQTDSSARRAARPAAHRGWETWA